MKERVGGRRKVRGEWRMGERLGIERLIENKKYGQHKGIGQVPSVVLKTAHISQ